MSSTRPDCFVPRPRIGPFPKSGHRNEVKRHLFLPRALMSKELYHATPDIPQLQCCEKMIIVGDKSCPCSSGRAPKKKATNRLSQHMERRILGPFTNQGVRRSGNQRTLSAPMSVRWQTENDKRYIATGSTYQQSSSNVHTYYSSFGGRRSRHCQPVVARDTLLVQTMLATNSLRYHTICEVTSVGYYDPRTYYFVVVWSATVDNAPSSSGRHTV